MLKMLRIDDKFRELVEVSSTYEKLLIVSKTYVGSRTCRDFRNCEVMRILWFKDFWEAPKTTAKCGKRREVPRTPGAFPEHWISSKNFKDVSKTLGKF